jgi:putative hydrolase of HD superfamily
MAFLLAADGLKSVLRASFIADGSRRENSAEHSWHVALMAIVLAEHAGDELDLGRVLALLTVHDLVEVYAGDTLIYDEAAVQGQPEREATAAAKLFGLLPADQREAIRGMWEEFEGGASAEAAYARAIDALAPTWIHWGEHAKNPATGLRADQVLERKSRFLEPYPVLFDLLKGIVNSAVQRGLIEG